jgi:hypothetical protein
VFLNNFLHSIINKRNIIFNEKKYTSKITLFFFILYLLNYMKSNKDQLVLTINTLKIKI